MQYTLNDSDTRELKLLNLLVDSVLKLYFLEKYPMVSDLFWLCIVTGQAIASVLSRYGVRIKRALRKKKTSQRFVLSI